MPLTANKLFRVQISDDRLVATLSLNGDVPPASISVDDIIAEIKILKIEISEDGSKAISDFAEALNQQQIPEPIVVAHGTAPEHDKNGKIQKLYEQQDTPVDPDHEEQDVAQESDGGDTVHSKSPTWNPGWH